MKNLLFLLFVSIFVFGCGENQEKDAPVITSAEEFEAEPQEDHLAWQQRIQLNAGEMWKANRETTEGILEMSHIVEKTDASSPEEYRSLGNELNEEKNLVIKRCTMKGPPHDNLHIYLQPLMAQIAELQEVTSAERGKQLVSEIKAHLSAYHSYFI